MDRFVYRKERRTSDFQRLDVSDRTAMLGVKLAATEAQLHELKALLDDSKHQRDHRLSDALNIIASLQDLK